MPIERAAARNESVIRALASGIAILLAGTIPRNLLFAANLRFGTAVPWAVPAVAAWIWALWRYLDGEGPPASSTAYRRASLRANPVSGPAWTWALLAGGLGIVTLVLGLRIVNRLVPLPDQQLPDLSHVPQWTTASLLLLSAPVAGVIEEAAFRGYMQRPLEQRFGIGIAILVTGTMFAIVHLDFTPVLWPYYVAVAAIYGVVSFLTDSILPAIVLHTAGNLFSNFDLWFHGRAEWQAPSAEAHLLAQTGPDRAFWMAVAWFSVALIATCLAYARLARVSAPRQRPGADLV